MNRAIRSLIARAKRQERDHVRGVKWNLKHGNYVEATRLLSWALQQQAYREGIEKASAPAETFVVKRADFPRRKEGRRR